MSQCFRFVRVCHANFGGWNGNLNNFKIYWTVRSNKKNVLGTYIVHTYNDGKEWCARAHSLVGSRARPLAYSHSSCAWHIEVIHTHTNLNIENNSGSECVRIFAHRYTHTHTQWLRLHWEGTEHTYTSHTEMHSLSELLSAVKEFRCQRLPYRNAYYLLLLVIRILWRRQ